MGDTVNCPKCGTVVHPFRNPVPTADILIRCTTPDGRKGIVLIRRKNPPYGWAIPGGFVDYGESMEDCAVREAAEETSLNVRLLRQFHTYSTPNRDPRHHTVTTVFLAEAEGVPVAQDDAAEIGLFGPDNLPKDLAFDHATILNDFFSSRY